MLYEQIENGWFNWKWLYDKVADDAKDGDICIEIGVWTGKSAVYLAERIKERGVKAKVLCIDPYYMGLHGTDVYHREDMRRFLDLHEFSVRNGLTDILIPVMSSSDEFAPVARSLKNVISVFIDGNHTYEGCTSDILNYYPIKPKYFGGHDYEPVNWNGVVRAVDDYFKPRSWLNIKIVEDVWQIIPHKIKRKKIIRVLPQGKSEGETIPEIE